MSYNIDNLEEGNWIVFYMNTGKKCIGKINLQILTDKNDNICTVPIVNYLDEDGLPGTIMKNDIPKDFSVIPIAMEDFFNSKHLQTKPRKSLKHFLNEEKNQN